MTGTRSTGGFSFIELIVALGIMLMIAATVVPVLVGTLDRARVERAAESLRAITEGMVAFENDVNDWPGQISQMSTGISTSMANSCGASFSNGNVNNYGGPYISRIPSAAGLNVFIGVAQNGLDRADLGGNNALLRIWIPLVTIDDVTELDRQVDASDGQTAGTVRWENPVSGRSLVYYAVPISGC